MWRAVGMVKANSPSLYDRTTTLDPMRQSHLLTLPVLLGIHLLLGMACAGEAGLPARPAAPAYLGVPPSQPIPNGSFTAVVAFPHLTFQGAVAVRAVPGTNRLWVLEREGRIWSFEDDPAATTKTLVLDLNDDDLNPGDATPLAGHLTNGTRWWCQGWDDSGLLGLAFHPQFAVADSPNRGHFYICYQARDRIPAIGVAPAYRPNDVSWGNDIPGCRNRLARFTVPTGSLQANPASELILIDQPDRHLWHNGGDLLFGNDGFLYLLNGDEGRADDHYERTQRVGGAFFGGVWRIDVDGPRAGISHAITNQPRRRNPADLSEPEPFTGNYGIPNDNPWVGLTGVLEEFWAIGLRSPHRMTIDPPSGRILVGDIGQGTREEINLIVKGGNYQWAYKEGHKNNRSDRQPPDYTVASATSAGTTSIPLTSSASITGNGLSPGQIMVGDLVRFTNHVDVYTVTGVSGYPHAALNLNPALTSAVPAGTTVRRTTGLKVAGIGAISDMTNAPNDYGKSQVLVSGSIQLALGDFIAFPGLAGSHQVIGIDGTTITIRPGFSQTGFNVSPKVTPPVADTFIDRLTVFGREQGPLVDFSRGGALGFNSIIGGYIYRGSTFPELVGKYLLGNNGGGQIVAIDPTHATLNTMNEADIPDTGVIRPAGPVTTRFFIPGYASGAHGYSGLGGFGVDHDGEPLLCLMQTPGQPTNASSGRLWKIIRSTSSVIGTPIPTDLKDTGTFVTDPDGTLTSLTPAAALIPYGVNSPLWSDATHKKRWVAIPDGTTVGFTATGTWNFPAGTVFVKHFELTVNEQTQERRRLETRLLVRSPGDGVYGVTYKWNTAGTAATLVAEAGESETYTITGPDGLSARQQTWNYPSHNDCLSCHNTNAGHVLGVSTRQLNGNYTYPGSGITDNQLHTWTTIGLFNTPPENRAIATLPSLVHVADPAATLERRVRSWLDANCSYCHQPGGVHAHFDARYDTPLRQQNLIEGEAMIALGLANPRIIARGDVTRSVMHLRDHSLDAAIKMPPLAKNLVDQQALTAMSAWIASLPYNPQISINNTSQVFDGTPKAVTVMVAPTGLPAPVITYQALGSGEPPTTTPPTAIGSYRVVAAVSGDLLYAGQATTTLTINDTSAPVIREGTAITVTCDEDNLPSSFALTLHTTDDNGAQTLTWSIIDPPDHGTLAPLGSGTTQVLAYVPAANFNGSDAFTVRVADDNGGNADCVVTVTVEPRNDAPVLVAAPAVSLSASTATATTGTWNDSIDLTPGTLTYALQWQRADDALGTNLVDLTGEVASNHTLTSDDVGRFLRVQVTASDDGEGLPATASAIAHSSYVRVVTAGGSGSGSSSSSSGGGGGCGLGGGLSALLMMCLVLLRRQRLR
ncbi:MAG: PQQ-dependent sugar dehydrogenase [Planctomycetes bacterium]|nr:PQQ-dependent sugar dehydrogenase [Planctomycetota bacterium]